MIKSVNLVYSADYRFQVVMVLPNISNFIAWDIMNGLATENLLEEQFGIEHYDIIEFKTFKEMNTWIKEQVKESRL